MKTNIPEIEEARAEAGDGSDLRSVSRGVAVFAAAALLLNGTALQRSTSMLEYGVQRNICMAFVKPVAAASSLLRADRLRSWIEKWTFLEER